MFDKTQLFNDVMCKINRAIYQQYVYMLLLNVLLLEPTDWNIDQTEF